MTNTIQSPRDLVRKLKLLEDILKLLFPGQDIRDITIEGRNEAMFGLPLGGNGVHIRYRIRWDKDLNFWLYKGKSGDWGIIYPFYSKVWARVYKLINDRHLDAENLKS